MYEAFRQLTASLLGQFGSDSAYLVSTDVSEYAHEMGKYIGNPITTETKIKAVFMPVEERREYGRAQQLSTTTRLNEVVVKIANDGLPSPPALGDKIKRGDEEYSIVSKPKAVGPGDVVLLYECEARRD